MRVTSQTIIISGSVNLVRRCLHRCISSDRTFVCTHTHAHTFTHILCTEINGCTFCWHFSLRTHSHSQSSSVARRKSTFRRPDRVWRLPVLGSYGNLHSQPARPRKPVGKSTSRILTTQSRFNFSALRWVCAFRLLLSCVLSAMMIINEHLSWTWRNWDSWHDSCDYKNTWNGSQSLLRMCQVYLCVCEQRSLDRQHIASRFGREIYFLLSWNGWVWCVSCGSIFINANSRRRANTRVAALFLSAHSTAIVSFRSVWSCASAAGQILIRNTWQIF